MLAFSAHYLAAQCVPTGSGYVYDPLACVGPPPGGTHCAPNASPICAEGLWQAVTFPDGYSPLPYVLGNGQGVTCYKGCQQASETCYNPSLYSCPPSFDAAVSPGLFIANAYDQTATIVRLQCGTVQFDSYALCSNNAVVSRWSEYPHTCCQSGQYYNNSSGSCVACTGSPAFECSEGASPVCTASGWGCPNGDTECVPPPGITDCVSPQPWSALARDGNA